MNRYFIKLAYKGNDYSGWQRQPNALTIQEILEDSLSMILQQPVKLTGAGRTDAGVHASEYFAHFDLDQSITPKRLDNLVFKLNGFLTENIVAYRIFQVESNFHARYSAISRTYKYFITTVKNPFRQDLTYFLYGPFDINLMNEASKVIMEYSDYTSFSKTETDTKTNICKIEYAHWDSIDNELVFTIKADRFLRNMVRAIVGTLIMVGRGKLTIGELRWIIESKNRSNAGGSAPACGLHLVRIEYPWEL